MAGVTERAVAWSVARGNNVGTGNPTMVLPGDVAEGDICILAVSLGASTNTDSSITLTVGADVIPPAAAKAATAGHSSHVYVWRATGAHAGATATFTRAPAPSATRYAMAAAGLRISTPPESPVNAVTNALRTSTATSKATPTLLAAGRSTLEVTVVAESTSTSTVANTAWTPPTGVTIAAQDNNGNTGGGAQSLAIGVSLVPRNTGNTLPARTYVNNSGHLTLGSAWAIGITSPTTPGRLIHAGAHWNVMQTAVETP